MSDGYLTVSSSGVDQGWIPLAEAAKLSPHGADYLSLLARRGKLAARKINDVWYTTPKNLGEYLTGQRVYREQARERLRTLLSSKSPSVGDVATSLLQPVHGLPQNTFFRTHSFLERSTNRKTIALSTVRLFLIGATMIGGILLASLSNPVFLRVRDFALRAGVPHEEVTALTRAHENFSNLVASNFGVALRSLTANVDDTVNSGPLLKFRNFILNLSSNDVGTTRTLTQANRVEQFASVVISSSPWSAELIANAPVSNLHTSVGSSALNILAIPMCETFLPATSIPNPFKVLVRVPTVTSSTEDAQSGLPSVVLMNIPSNF